MSTNKENVKLKSKIPVLKEIPTRRHVIDRIESSTGEVQRDPLRTIANENVDENCFPGTSRDIPVLNTRHVTHRDKKEELDWKFEVFGGSSHRTLKNVPQDHVTSGRSNNAQTPSVLSQSVTKKVKKSLKRPHSIGIRDMVSPIAARAPVTPPLLNIESKPANLNFRT